MWKRLLIILGALIFLYAIYFAYQVWHIRKEILAGTYDFSQYGTQISGTGGANVSDKTYAIATAGSPAIGATNPKVTIVEFGDFQCPFCKQAYPIIRSLVSEYQNDVRFVYRHFPLDDIHPLARLAAQAGYCANLQNRFWPLHDKMYQDQDKLSRAYISTLAIQVGLDQNQFTACLDSADAQAAVERDWQAGLSAGASGTPTWFINGIRVAGVIPEAVLRQIIEGLIKK